MRSLTLARETLHRCRFSRRGLVSRLAGPRLTPAFGGVCGERPLFREATQYSPIASETENRRKTLVLQSYKRGFFGFFELVFFRGAVQFLHYFNIFQRFYVEFSVFFLWSEKMTFDRIF